MGVVRGGKSTCGGIGELVVFVILKFVQYSIRIGCQLRSSSNLRGLGNAVREGKSVCHACMTRIESKYCTVHCFLLFCFCFWQFRAGKLGEEVSEWWRARARARALRTKSPKSLPVLYREEKDRTATLRLKYP